MNGPSRFALCVASALAGVTVSGMFVFVMLAYVMPGSQSRIVGWGA